MLHCEEFEIEIGRGVGGDFMRFLHKPTGITRSHGPPLRKPGRVRNEMLAEIEGELLLKGLMQYVGPPFQSPLPVGWFYPDATTSLQLHDELQCELHPSHSLCGCAVKTFAWRAGATDDVLFYHVDEPNRFTLIHLSWIGRTEINALHPTVEFDGTFAGFVALEAELYGLVIPPSPPK